MLLFRSFLAEEILHGLRILRLNVVELDTEVLQGVDQRND
jgi:hypothetical protein